MYNAPYNAPTTRSFAPTHGESNALVFVDLSTVLPCFFRVLGVV